MGRLRAAPRARLARASRACAGAAGLAGFGSEHLEVELFVELMQIALKDKAGNYHYVGLTASVLGKSDPVGLG